MNNLKEWIAVLEAGSPLTNDEMRILIKEKLDPQVKGRIIAKHLVNKHKDHVPKVITRTENKVPVIPYTQD